MFETIMLLFTAVMETAILGAIIWEGQGSKSVKLAEENNKLLRKLVQVMVTQANKPRKTGLEKVLKRLDKKLAEKK